MEVDPHEVTSVAGLGEALTHLKRRSGRSLSQLSGATAAAATGGLSRSTLNGYFKGRHLPQQGVGDGFRLLLRELGVDDTELDAWWATVERLRRVTTTDARPGNPYPGLRSFETSDAGRFFGRNGLTDRLAEQVKVSVAAGNPVMVVGVSGAGKSSLLRAGLVPRLHAAGWTPLVMTAGKRPFTTLLARLGLEPDSDVGELEPGLRYALIGDQLEEAFSSDVSADERERFLTAVCSMARTMPVVLGLRADFYGHVLRHPELTAALQASQLVVGPMNDAELREAITEPARQAGFTVEDGLVELLLREVAPGQGRDHDAAHEQGTLPLLSHALQATFEAAVAEGGARTMTVRAYRSAGGIEHAVAETAENAFTALSPREQRLARQLFLRLVEAGSGTADTRRVADRDELFGQRCDAEFEELDDVVDTLVSCRLLTADDTSVQISHEALLTAWPRLRGWLDDGRAGRQVHRRLTHAARDWRNNGRSGDDLYQGRTLASRNSRSSGLRSSLPSSAAQVSAAATS